MSKATQRLLTFTTRQDRDTGTRVTRLTPPDVTCHRNYFYQKCFNQDGSQLIFAGEFAFDFLTILDQLNQWADFRSQLTFCTFNRHNRVRNVDFYAGWNINNFFTNSRHTIPLPCDPTGSPIN